MCSDDLIFFYNFYFLAWKTFSPLFHPPRQGVQRDMFANTGSALHTHTCHLEGGSGTKTRW